MLRTGTLFPMARATALMAAPLLLLACGSDQAVNAPPPVVASIAVTPGADTLVTLGRTRQYAAQARDAFGSPIAGIAFVWHSSNPAVATVDSATGVATAVTNGLANVIATASGITGQASLAVAQAVAAVQVTPGSAALSAVGVPQAFAAAAKDSSGASVSGVRFLWVSSNPGIATVDTNGLATSRGPGTVTISATGRGVPGYAGLTVTQLPRQLAFSVQPSAVVAGDAISPAIQVEIRDSAGALVSAARNAVAISLGANPAGGALGGTVTVNAVGGIATFSGLTIDKPASGYTLAAAASGLTGAASSAFDVTAGTPTATIVTVSPGSAAIGALGSSRQFTAEVRDRQGVVMTGAVVRWRSGDTSVATIDSVTGLALARANGTADIIARASGVDGRASLTVSQVVAAVAVTPGTNNFVSFGDTVHLTAAATDSNGNPVSGIKFLWGSSNPIAALVDSVGVVTAVGKGSAAVSATGLGVPGYAGVSVHQVPARWVFTSQPLNRVAGQLQPTINLEIHDANGHLIDTTLNSVRLALAVNPGADTLPYQFTSTAHGAASFFAVWLTKAATGYRLAVNYGGVPSDSTIPFNITPGPAYHWAFTQQPPSQTPAMVSFGPVSATGTDSYGNPVSVDTVTLQLRSPWANARLLGHTHTTTSAGVATFDSVWVDKPGTSLRLLARSDSSTAFAVHVPFSGVATQNGATCGVAPSGAYCWGYNGSGILGESRYARDSVPGPIDSAITFVEISVASAFVCARTSGGAVYCWGNNGSGQLGRGTTGSYTSVPAQVSGSGSGSLVFTQISAGNSSTCGVTTGHAVYCWGDNTFAELGDSTLTASNVPVLVKGTGGGGLQMAQVSVSIGYVGAFACGVTTGNAAYCWGVNYTDVLGSGALNDTARVPRAVIGGHAFSKISAGGHHTCALDTGSAAYCWGANDSLQFGVASATTTTPTAVSGGLTFTSISAGWDHTCAVTGPKALYCWGGNGFGQLGDGSTTKRGSPTAALGGYTWGSISAGYYGTCGVTNAALACTGKNDLGQLGDGSQTERHQPTLVVQ